jgi:hypothetical protein
VEITKKSKHLNPMNIITVDYNELLLKMK